MDIRTKFHQILNRKRGPVQLFEISDDENDENNNEQYGMNENIGAEIELDFNDEEEEIEFEVGTTNRGAICLWNGGYRYTNNRGNFWRCTNRQCPARAKTEPNEDGQYMGTISGSHFHPPEAEQKGAEKNRVQIKEKLVAEPRAKQRRIIAEVRSKAPLEVVAAMGSNNALNLMVKRKKKELFGNVNTENPLEMNLPDVLLIKDEESTLLYDSRQSRPGEADVVFVFSHPKLLQILAKNREWAIDGTFKCAPKPFVQCFCIGAFVHGKMVVCAQGLLPSKRRIHYEEMLGAIQRAIHPATPSQIISDFEKAEIGALRRIFPTATLTGCLFHFCQSLYRKWRDLGLERIQGENTDEGAAARETFRRILALPLIPAQHIRRGFGLIIGHSPPALANFLAYFASVYIGQTQIEMTIGPEAFQRGVNVRISSPNISASNSRTIDFSSSYSEHPYGTPLRFGIPSIAPSTPSMPETIPVPRWQLPIVRRPQFEIEFWCVHERAIAARAKTNNALESSHLHFVKNMNHHPSMSEFLLGVLGDVDKQWDIARTAPLFGHQRHKKYILKELAIMETLTNALANGEYEDNDGLLDLITLLGLQMRNFLAGLHVIEEGREPEDEPDVSNDGTIPSTSNY